MIRVLIAGEGPNEIGSGPAGERREGERSRGAGVIEALLAKVRPAGWELRDKNTTAMVELVRNARLLDVPVDAVSFWRWLRRVAEALRVLPIPREWPRPGG